MTKLGLSVLAGVAMAAVGCAEPLHLVDRSRSAGASPYSFWPPPPSSALWLPPPTFTTSGALGAIASRVDSSLARAGYAETRWYRIGSDCQHGFALTTRLERLDVGPNAKRWSPFYPEPASLRWLSAASAPSLAEPGRYRAFLIAFTDLPMPSGRTAPRWNEQTIMDGPDAPIEPKLTQARGHQVTPAYRFGIYEYDYDWDETEQRVSRGAGHSSAINPAWPPPLRDLAPSDSQD